MDEHQGKDMTIRMSQRIGIRMKTGIGKEKDEDEDKDGGNEDKDEG